MPAIYCFVEEEGTELSLSVSNGGRVAFNVEIVALCRFVGNGDVIDGLPSRVPGQSAREDFWALFPYRHAVLAEGESILIAAVH